MKSPEQRGAVGQWMREHRLEQGWSQSQAVAELRKLGYHMAETTYRLFESGNRQPGAESAEALATLWGPLPTAEEKIGTADLVKAIYALVEELRLEREARVGIAEGAERAAAVLEGGPPPAESPAAQLSPRPRGTRRGSLAGSPGR